jgi:autophagy-related protein 17
VAIEELIREFNAYQLSYDKLLVEIARRRHYKEEAENFVQDMTAQLETMSEGVFLYIHRPARLFRLDDVPAERVVRESFNAEHGAHLPSDLCLYIENPPTRWQVIPFDGVAVESLPDVDDDLVMEVHLDPLPVS